MIKRMRLLFNNKGITLMELIMAIFVMSIIMIAATAVFAPMFQAYQRANNLAEVNTLLDNLAALVMDDVANARRIEQGPEGVTITTSRGIVYFLDDENNGNENILFKRAMSSDGDEEGLPVLQREFYRSTHISVFDLVEEANGVVRLTLQLTSADGWVRDRTYTARPVGLAG